MAANNTCMVEVPLETHGAAGQEGTLEPLDYVERKPWKYKAKRDYRVRIDTDHAIFVPRSKCCEARIQPAAQGQDGGGESTKSDDTSTAKGCCCTPRGPLVVLVTAPSGRVCEVVVKEGYAWDGASGPTFDTRASMEAALVHDVLYQCMRLGYLSTGERDMSQLPAKERRKLRKNVDLLFLKMLDDGGMRGMRRRVWYRAVRWLGRKASQPKPHKDRRLAGALITSAGGGLVFECVSSRWSAQVAAIGQSMAECFRTWGLDVALGKVGGWPAVGSLLCLLAGIVLAWVGIELVVGDKGARGKR